MKNNYKKTITWLCMLALSQLAHAAITDPDASLLDSQNNTEASVSATNADLWRPASNINDGNELSYWSNHNNPTHYFDNVVGDLGIAVAVNRIELSMDPGVSFVLEYYDGTDWVLVDNLLSASNAVNSYSVPGITAQKWRLRNFHRGTPNSAKGVGIAEWKIFGVVNEDPSLNSEDGEHWQELARAPIDECFFGVGSDQNIYPKGDAPCPEGSLEKQNETYVWGMTYYSDDTTHKLYFGSGANVQCLGQQTYLLTLEPIFAQNERVCEFSQSAFGGDDWRPPSLYIYDLDSDSYSKKSLTGTAGALLEFTTGLRSAGTYHDIVFIGGPNRSDGINLFAFVGSTGELLGATVIDYGYTNLRKMEVIDDQLYIGVGGAESSSAVDKNSGAVLRWAGDVIAILAGDHSSLFDFEVVGTGLDDEATELTAFEGRIFASTWPNENSSTGGGLWQSPSLPIDTYSASDKLEWQTDTSGDNATLLFQANGNLVLQAEDGTQLWQSDTADQNASKAVLQDNGKLAIYANDDQLLWCSDSEWALDAEYAEFNKIAIGKATTLLPGQQLQSDETLASHTGHYRLSIENGNLQINSKDIPWTRVWGADEYEPDPLVASTYGAGAAAEFEGWLYWGTMHVPFAALTKYEYEHGLQLPVNRAGLTAIYHREGSIFRARNIGQPNQEIELLYGGQGLAAPIAPGYFPVHTGFNYVNVVEFKWEQNKMGLEPKYGRGGFNNTFNNYIWTMMVYNDDLYIGTMDHAKLFLNNETAPNISGFVPHKYGGDLFRFDSSETDAVPVTLDGLGNWRAYGFRTIATDGTHLYLGTANNANLNANGGWQLYKFTADEIEADPDGKTKNPPLIGSLSTSMAFAMLLLLLARGYLAVRQSQPNIRHNT